MKTGPSARASARRCAEESEGRLSFINLRAACSPIRPPAHAWVRDLTAEGIEPHPGPSGSPRVISKNLNGIQGDSKYRRFFKYVAAQHQLRPIIAFLGQEHNLKREDKDSHQRLAHHYRLLAIINYSPSEGERGGTLILIPYESVVPIENEHGKLETTDEARSRVAQSRVFDCAGRLTRVTMQVEGKMVHLTAAYAHAKGPRPQFFNRARQHLSKTTILGIDANCVPDETIDLERDATSPYDNLGANELAESVAHFDLTDVAREQLGRVPFFTSTHSTLAGLCRSRIDQLYAPNVDGMLWTHASLPDFWTPLNPLGQVDHIALEISLQLATGERGHDVTRVSEEVFNTDAFNDTVNAAIKQSMGAWADLPSDELGQRWVDTKDAVVALCDKETRRLKAERKRTRTELDARIEATQSRVSAGLASKKEIQELGRARLQRAVDNHKSRTLYEQTEDFAVRQWETHDTGRAAFHRQWTPKNAAQWVPDVMNADWTDPSNPTNIQKPISDAPKIANGFKQYYGPLFGEKRPDPEHLSTARELLRNGRRVLDPTAEMCAAPLEATELRAISENLPTDKSPGPDRLPNKFYKVFSRVVAPILAAVFNKAREAGSLHPRILEGQISVLYKKKKRDDPRNYRPITLLNGDYKIMMRALTARMNEAVVQFVSDPQNGFVPNSFLPENIMLLKLLQTHADEESEDYMMLFADMEKAFDRASWEFMDAALEDLNLGGFRDYFRLAYSSANPPTRRIYVNGYLSDSFPLQSGVAQGCPLSPLLFLLVTEILTRAIETDDNYKGIVVNGVAHKVSQFADDGTFMMTLGDEIRLAIHMLMWEGATGMRENVDKREGLLVGPWHRRPHEAPSIVPSTPNAPHGWIPRGSWLRALGVPMGNDFDETAWWHARYRLVKQRLARWKASSHLSLVGRNTLLQAHFYGSFRFWLFSMVLPPAISKLIETDAKHMLWASDPSLCASEDGSSTANHPFIRCTPSHLPRKKGGGGVMNWSIHTDAFYAQWGKRYLDPRDAPWKKVMDKWLADEYHMGRGALLGKIGAAEHFFTDIPDVNSARYARRCIREFENLKLGPATGPPTPDSAGGPIFNNHAFDVNIQPDHPDVWGKHLNLIQIIDLVDRETGDFHTAANWEHWFYPWAPAHIRDTPRAHEWVDERIRELRVIQNAIPPPIIEAIPSAPHIIHDAYVGVLDSPLDSDIVKSPPRFAQVEVPADPDTLPILHEVWLDLSGIPHRTGKTIYWLGRQVIEASMWHYKRERYTPIRDKEQRATDDDSDCSEEDGVAAINGLRGSCFPADDGWRPRSFPPPRDPPPGHRPVPERLSSLTIRQMTKAHTTAHVGSERPTCEKSWEDDGRVGRPLPWDIIWPSIGTELTDPTEESRWIILLHRGTFARNRKPDGPQECRFGCLCTENIVHLLGCTKMRHFWDPVFKFMVDIGLPRCEHPFEAIVFGLWTKDTLGPEEGRAILRHAWNEYNRRAALVDLQNEAFSIPDALLCVFSAIKRAVQRRGGLVKRHHAHRKYSSKTSHIPKADAEKFPGLVTMSTTGSYVISPILEAAIVWARKEADTAKTARKQARSKNEKANLAKRRKRTIAEVDD